MKAIVFLVTTIVAGLAFGKEVKNTDITISPATIDNMVQLVNKEDLSDNHKKLSLIVKDTGRSTDFSPRFTVYLGYGSFAEAGNLTASFELTKDVIKVISANRLEAGIYELLTSEIRESDEGSMRLNVRYQIDARKMFADEQALRKVCNVFCDKELSTAITVTEKTTKIK